MSLSDAEARRAALDVRESIVLQAPAGSGKTTILTQRFLALLATVDAPEAVLALTFTRKAAAEMRTRIVAALADAEAENAPRDAVHAATREFARAAAAHAEARGWQLRDNPSRLRIMTIDGLNRQFAVAAPIGARGLGAMDVAEHPQRLHREAARAALLDAEDDSELCAHSDRVLRHLGNSWERAEQLLAEMLATRARWLRPLIKHGPPELQALVERNLRAVCDETAAAAVQVLGAVRIAAGQALAAHAITQLRNDGRDREAEYIAGAEASTTPKSLRALARFALTKDASDPVIRARVDIRMGFVAKTEPKLRMEAWLKSLREAPQVHEVLLALRDLPDETLDAEGAATLDSLLQLLRYTAVQLVHRFNETGRADYIEIATAARTLVSSGEPGSEMILHQGETLRHLLVDEFQDTSLDQLELLHGLTRDWAAGDGRTLFVVGDPMQSIYQFREAEVGLFLEVRDKGLGAIRFRRLELTHNFRSQPAIVDFVNRTFARVFPLQDAPVEGAVRYLPCVAAAAPTEVPRAGVHWHVFADDADYPAREAAAVLEAVRDLRREQPRASIAVLVAARAHARELVLGLRAAGIAVQGVDLVPLVETSVVQDLIALTRALHSASDRVAWLAVLRAPWCGLSLADLTLLVDGAPKAAVRDLWCDAERRARLSSEGRAALERFIAAFEPWGDESRRDPLGDANLATRVEAAWLRLDGPSCHDDVATLADARRYFDALAAEIDAGDWQGPEDFDWMLGGLYAASDAADDAVQVMTIHRSKGLEFDGVILAGMGRVPRSDPSPLLDFVECVTQDGTDTPGQRRLLLAPVRAADAPPPAIARFVKGFKKRRELRERMRVLYVAATRARSQLHCLGALQFKDGELVAGKRSALQLLWPAIEVDAVASWHANGGDAVAAGAKAKTVERAVGRSLRRLPAARVRTVWPKNIATARLPVSSGELVGERVLDFAVASELARAAGVVVHRELERWGGRASLPTPEQIQERSAAYAAALRAEGVSRAELAAGVARVIGALQRTVSDERGRWILSRHVEDHFELALTGSYEGVISSIVIDRSFVHEGVRWVIDYKTSAHEGANLEAFLDAQRERYAAQLRRYAEFARHLGPEPVRTALYFPLLGAFVEIADASR